MDTSHYVVDQHVYDVVEIAAEVVAQLLELDPGTSFDNGVLAATRYAVQPVVSAVLRSSNGDTKLWVPLDELEEFVRSSNERDTTEEMKNGE